MNIEELQAWLANMCIPFVHFSPDKERAGAASKACFYRGEDCRFIVASLRGAACEHVPVVIIEDPADIDPTVLDEIGKVSAPRPGHQAMVIRYGRGR